MAVVSNVQFRDNPPQVLLKMKPFRKKIIMKKTTNKNTSNMIQQKFSNSKIVIQQAGHVNLTYLHVKSGTPEGLSS